MSFGYQLELVIMSGVSNAEQWSGVLPSDATANSFQKVNPEISGGMPFNPEWQSTTPCLDHTTGQQSSAVSSQPDPNNLVAANSTPGEKAPLKFFVGGIHPDCWDDELRGYFGQFAAVKDVLVMSDRMTGRNRGFGFVTLEDSNDKSKIFDTDHFIRGKKCSVRIMQPDGHSNLKRKVFIGGINPAITEAELEPYFKTWGCLEKLTIMRDVEGNSRGFGFVIFNDEHTCKRVVDHRVHSIDKDTKVECRQAEARGRVPSRGMAVGRGGRLPPNMGGGGYPPEALCYDPNTFDWNPALAATAYGIPAAFAGSPYSAAQAYAPPLNYGVMGMTGGETNSPHSRYDPSYGPMRGGGSGRGVPLKRTYPY